MSKVISVVYPAPCLTCAEPIEAGDTANWESHVGIWHLDCEEPRHLQFYIDRAREREQYRHSGSSERKNA